MPSNIKPMLATLVKEPFNDPAWLFEIKWDGYRAIAEADNGKVNLHSRRNISFNSKFHEIAEACSQIPNQVILDGEIVVLDENGKSDFQLLQNYQRTGEGNIVYYLFDILYLDGYDLRDLPLSKRKEILMNSGFDVNEKIRYSDHIEAEGKDFFKAAGDNGLEGIIAKKSSSIYQSGKRSKEWLKIKTHQRQEAVIAGFTKPRGSRKDFGALVLGLYEGNEFTYIGHTGSGFDEQKLKEIRKKLEPLIIKSSPFKKRPKTNMPVTWVKPELVCEITFSEWTEDGNMRHPIFISLREDKNPEEVKKELPLEETRLKKKLIIQDRK